MDPLRQSYGWVPALWTHLLSRPEALPPLWNATQNYLACTQPPALREWVLVRSLRFGASDYGLGLHCAMLAATLQGSQDLLFSGEEPSVREGGELLSALRDLAPLDAWPDPERSPEDACRVLEAVDHLTRHTDHHAGITAALSRWLGPDRTLELLGLVAYAGLVDACAALLDLDRQSDHAQAAPLLARDPRIGPEVLEPLARHRTVSGSRPRGSHAGPAGSIAGKAGPVGECIDWVCHPDAVERGVAELLTNLGTRLSHPDVGVSRLTVAALPIHGGVAGFQQLWRAAEPDTCALLTWEASYLQSSEYLEGPLCEVLTSGADLHLRLTEEQVADRFPFAAALSAEGVTDYLVWNLASRDIDGLMLTMALHRPDGLDADLRETLDVLVGLVRPLLLLGEAQRLADLAVTDTLTGLANRRAADAALEQIWAHCHRTASPVSVIRFGIDGFAELEEQYGHAVGNNCLRQIAGAVRPLAKRGGDVLARTEGEVFLLVLPMCELADAVKIGERLRLSVTELVVPGLENRVHPHLTVGVGVASMTPTTLDTPLDLVRRADQALARAMGGTGNRVEAQSVEPVE